MKKKFKISILLLMVTIILFSLKTSIKAANYKVVENFPTTIQGITIPNENRVTYQDGKWHYQVFQQSNVNDLGNVGIICTKFHANSLPTAPATCSLDLETWGNQERIQVGVASIIKDANSLNTQMNENYFYEVLAINNFLYHYNVDTKGQSKFWENNVIGDKASDDFVNQVLGGYNYYINAINAVKKYDQGIEVQLKPAEDYPSNYKFDTFDEHIKIRNYILKGTNIDSATLKLKIKDPSGNATITLLEGSRNIEISNNEATIENLAVDKKIRIILSNNITNDNLTNNIQGTDYTIIISYNDSNIDTNGLNFSADLSVEGTMNYSVAANYTCTYDNKKDYQTVTLNAVQNKTMKDTDRDLFSVFVNKNAPAYPSLEINKVDQSNTPITGAGIRVSEIVNEKSTTVRAFYNDDKSTYKMNSINPGRYCVSEYKAPNGYLLDRTKSCFTINLSGNEISISDKDGNVEYDEVNNKISVTLTNTPNKVEIRKVNEQGNIMPGVNMRLVKDDGSEFEVNGVKVNAYDFETIADYTASVSKVITRVSPGTYRLYEISTIPGYIKTDDYVTFTVTNFTENTIKTTLVNKPIVLNISKKDITNTESELKGATLQILDENRNLVKIGSIDLEWDSKDATKKITNIPAGKYYLHEIVAPDGYVLREDDIEFVIDQYGIVTVNNEEQKDSLVVMSNKKNSVTISKQDLTSKQELPGAYLQITDTKGNIVKTIDGTELKWQSTDKPYVIEGLKKGTYVLTETLAPDGYVLSKESIIFTIDAKGKVTVNDKKLEDTVVIMTNALTKVVISKQDITNKGKELPGATLRILNKSGEIATVNGKPLEWVSTDEPYVIEGLREGDYTLVEITAPDGYSLNEEKVTFSINADGSVSGNTTMYNTPITKVPSTLSTQSIIITLAGIVFVGVGIGLYIYGIKKNKEI